MHEELKSSGYPGGADNELILKSDGELAIRAVKERLSRYHGGRITPEPPPKGESSREKWKKQERRLEVWQRCLKI